LCLNLGCDRFLTATLDGTQLGNDETLIETEEVIVNEVAPTFAGWLGQHRFVLFDKFELLQYLEVMS